MPDGERALVVLLGPGPEGFAHTLRRILRRVLFLPKDPPVVVGITKCPRYGVRIDGIVTNLEDLRFPRCREDVGRVTAIQFYDETSELKCEVPCESPPFEDMDTPLIRKGNLPDGEIDRIRGFRGSVGGSSTAKAQ